MWKIIKKGIVIVTMEAWAVFSKSCSFVLSCVCLLKFASGKGSVLSDQGEHSQVYQRFSGGGLLVHNYLFCYENYISMDKVQCLVICWTLQLHQGV